MDHTLGVDDLDGVKPKRWQPMLQTRLDSQFRSRQDWLKQHGMLDPHQHATGRRTAAGPQSLTKNNRQGLGTPLDQLQKIQTFGIGQTSRAAVFGTSDGQKFDH